MPPALDNAAKLAATKAKTFKGCAEAYMAAHRGGWRNSKHAAQWAATLGTYVFPIMGDLPVDAIDDVPRLGRRLHQLSS
jgi:hypothetical protein